MRTAAVVGLLDCGNGLEALCVLTDTYELMVNDNLMGNLLVSPITVEGYIHFSSRDVAESICKELKVDGVLLTPEYLITFKKGKAQYRLVTSPKDVVKEVDYDTNICVEENITWE